MTACTVRVGSPLQRSHGNRNLAVVTNYRVGRRMSCSREGRPGLDPLGLCVYSSAAAGGESSHQWLSTGVPVDW
jgi:hypothetical protein